MSCRVSLTETPRTEPLPPHTDKDPPSPGFPLGLENLEKWEGIIQSGNFEQTGKVSENHTKYGKTEGI